MKKQSLITKSTFFGIIFLHLGSISNNKTEPSTRKQSPQDLFACINAKKRWDYESKSCVARKPWQKLPEHLKHQLDRPLDLEELKQAKEEMNLNSWQTIAKKNRPHAIILIGTAGSGKSTLVASLGKWFEGFEQNNYVQFDGDILRRNHDAYREISSQDNVAYTDAWLLAKPHFASMKSEILDEIISENRNVIIPTGVHGPRYHKILRENDYQITLVGVFVDFETAYYRGMNRAEWTGRTYTGSYGHWQTGLKHMEALSQESDDASVLFINNCDFDSPKEMSYEELSSMIE